MKFETLKEKCEYYRSLGDDRLIPNMPIIVMCDGRSFSHYIKNRFKLPFDDAFINAMNETAKYLCEQIQGAQFAYVQSDEISILISDYKNPDSDAFFGFRKCKMLSTIAAMASAKFNRILEKDAVEKIGDYAPDILDTLPLFTFDCKVWNVPNENEAFAWFLYRQNDCVRNSKQQFAQTYIPHKQLMGKIVDEQIEMVKALNNQNWHDFDEGKKYGRLIYKESSHYKKEINGKEIEYDRNEFMAHYAPNLNEHPEKLRNLI